LPGLDITPRLPAGRQLIQGYGEGGFRVAGQKHSGSVIVFPERTISWAVSNHTDVSVDSLAAATGSRQPAQILLVGCGPKFVPPPVELSNGLREYGFALEWMDTGAACRTFNVLLFDDRAVTAALIAVS
jgi:uncharacterized protein